MNDLRSRVVLQADGQIRTGILRYGSSLSFSIFTFSVHCNVNLYIFLAINVGFALISSVSE